MAGPQLLVTLYLLCMYDSRKISHTLAILTSIYYQGYAKGDSARNEKQEIFAETPKGTTPSWLYDMAARRWYEGPTNPNQRMYEYSVGTYYVSMRDTLVATEIRSNLNGKGYALLSTLLRLFSAKEYQYSFYSLKIFVDYVTMIPDLVHRYGEK